MLGPMLCPGIPLPLYPCFWYHTLTVWLVIAAFLLHFFHCTTSIPSHSLKMPLLASFPQLPGCYVVACHHTDYTSIRSADGVDSTSMYSGDSNGTQVGAHKCYSVRRWVCLRTSILPTRVRKKTKLAKVEWLLSELYGRGTIWNFPRCSIHWLLTLTFAFLLRWHAHLWW